MPERVIHDSFTIEKSYKVSPARVFAAFADPERKRRWYAETGAHDVVSYMLDFRVGGEEALVGRMRAGTPVAGATLTWRQAFVDIAPDGRIVFTQTVDMDGRLISCALATVEIEPAGAGTLLRFTHQAAFFEGADGPHLRRIGWDLLLSAAEGAME